MTRVPQDERTTSQEDIPLDRLERAARALYDADPHSRWPRRWGWTVMPEPKKDLYRQMALAALNS